MPEFDSALGRVELTAERIRHIIRFHPEVRLYLRHLPATLARPDFVRRSKFDALVRICYYRLKGQKYLAVVVKTNERNFILTAYITYEIQHQPL